MDVELFDYELPIDSIAQSPHIPRDECRLMVCSRQEKSVKHTVFKEIVDYLKEGDLLVLNDTKVIPARLFATKKTGGKIEVFLLEEIEKNRYLCLTKGKIKDGIEIKLKNGIPANLKKTDSDKRIITFEVDEDIKQLLDYVGEVPLPPYIKRDYNNYDRQNDFKYYQTVYAKRAGAVASPTAGLHFSKELLDKIRDKGVNTTYITLHVGIGTFRPVKEKTVEAHKMHEEYYEISEDTAKLYNKTKNRGRIIAVGTTVVRALESAQENGLLQPKKDKTSIFIYPGYKYKAVDALITNFHLPKSTLLMLVSAFYSRKEILECYKEAVLKKYRFFSFGDAMFIY